MDPFSVLGVTASIIACIQLAGAIAKRVGPSSHDISQLNRIIAVVSGFRTAYQGLRLCLGLDERDEARNTALQYLEGPLKESKAILDFLQERLRNVSLIGQHVVGIVGQKLKDYMKRLEDARSLFELATHADQRTILSAIENYIKNAAKTFETSGRSSMRMANDYENTASEAANINKKLQVGIDHGERVGALNAAIETHGTVTKRICVDIEHLRKEADETKTNRLVDEIITWLANTSPSLEHTAARAKHQPNTGTWFLQTYQYLQWKASPKSFLWVHGIPGCGKSILCSTVIESLIPHCNSTESCGLSYYYFTFNDTEKQSAINFIRSIIAQLLATLPRIPKFLMQDLQKLCRAGRSVASGSLPVLMDILKSLTTLINEVYVVLDALDEAENQDGQLEQICKTLVELAMLPNLHILVTSRKEHLIEQELSRIPSPKLVSFFLPCSQIDGDIRQFVDMNLKEDPRLSRWPACLKEEIRSTLLEASDGMFRWVFCQLATLKTCLSAATVRKTLGSLPRSLDDTYSRILSGIGEEHRELAITALKWLVVSERPLQVEELAEAAIIQPKLALLNQDDRFIDPRGILAGAFEFGRYMERDPTFQELLRETAWKETCIT